MGGGGFNREIKDAKGPLFDLTAAFWQTIEFARYKGNGLLVMNFMLECLRNHSPLFYHVVDRVLKTSIYFVNWSKYLRWPTRDRDANKSTSAK